jgi:putative isomerase
VFWKSLPIKVRAWSGFIPLWAGIADQDQAKAMEAHITDTQTFWSSWGVTSLAMDEKMFDVRATNNPSNWLGPIWIVVQYIVFRGLMDYGMQGTATELARRTLDLLGRDLLKTGTLHEYYEPSTGEPVMNGGFINWNILALNMADESRGRRPMDRT